MFRQMLAFAVGVAVVIGIGTAPASDDAAAKKKMPPNTDAIFKKLDADKSGKLDLDEFKKLFSQLPQPKGKKGKKAGPVDLEVVYKSLDANMDGTLDPQEFKGVLPAVAPQKK